MDAYLKGQPKSFFTYIGYSNIKTISMMMLQQEQYDEVVEKYNTKLFSLHKKIQREFKAVYDEDIT